MRRVFCLSVFFLLHLTVSAQENVRNFLGNGRDTSQLKKSVDSFNKKGFDLRDTLPSVSHSYLLNALKLSREINYLFGEGTSLKHIGFYHRYRWENRSAVDSTYKALKIFEKLGDTLEQITCKYNLSVALSYMGLKDTAIKLSLQGIKQAEGIKNAKWFVLHNVQIGNIYSSVKETDTAKRYLNLAKIFAERVIPKDVFRTYQGLGEVAEQEKKWVTALHWYSAGLDYSLKSKPQHTILLIANEIDIANAQCELASYYHSYYYYDSAILIIQNTKAIIARNADFSGYSSWANYVLTKAYIGKQSFDSAKKYAIYCMNDKRNMGPIYYSEEVQGLLADIFHAQGQNDSSYKYLNNYIKYKDSVNDIGAIKKWSTATLANRVSQQNTIMQLQEESNRQKNRITFAQTAILLLLAIVSFWLFRSDRKNNSLLLNILPLGVIREWRTTSKVRPQYYDNATVLFTDFEGFTKASDKMNAADVLNALNEYFTAFDDIIAKYPVEKIKTIGDAYMLVGGLPNSNETHAIDVVKVALEIRNAVEKINARRQGLDETYFNIRIGINTGPVIAGVIGKKKFAYDIWGRTVNLASRMEHYGEAGKINISKATYEMIRGVARCTPRDVIEVKGLGMQETFFLDNLLENDI